MFEREASMFQPGNKREADITLCLFPHLREFVAVDARADLPDGPAVRLISFNDIFTQEFRKSLESGFSRLINEGEPDLQDMIGLPQEVEALVRTESLKRVVLRLNEAAGAGPKNPASGVGALFFSGGLLAIQREQLATAMRELFSQALNPGQIDTLTGELIRLIEEEKAAEDSARTSDLSNLITGRGGSFMTLWENQDEGE